jgi:hypothetical protein
MKKKSSKKTTSGKKSSNVGSKKMKIDNTDPTKKGGKTKF